MNIIGDIAGQYDALIRLVDKMPKEEIILVGDLVDRHNKGKQVIQWAIDNNVQSLLGNHEHMMLNRFERKSFYAPEIWLENGGLQTIESYLDEKYDPDQSVFEFEQRGLEAIPKEHIEWLRQRPLYYEADGLFVSHAAKHPNFKLEDCMNLGEGYYDRLDFRSELCLIWNRSYPAEIKGVFQVFGHNAGHHPRFYSRTYPLGYKRHHPTAFAACIDASRAGVLTGLNFPSMKIYQEKF